MKTLLRLIKVLLLLIFIVLIGYLSYLVPQKMKWPEWSSLIIFSFGLSLLLGIFFLKRFFLRKKEKKFIKRIIEQDNTAIQDSPHSHRLRLEELQAHWKESIQKLQNSHLKKYGNPLYVLPWFLILGESRNGKTTAIKNARLSSALTEVAKTSGIYGTRNCDWWFFEEAIILDTAGRYSIPIEEGPDLEEWKEFLLLLSKYRKKEPLNGVVVVIAADKLLQSSSEELEDIGQSLRQRIDHMMQIMGAKFPVYVLVTKMDLVYGFTDLASMLPDTGLEQTMGYTNSNLYASSKEVLNLAKEDIVCKLNELLLILSHKSSDLKPGVLTFPLEMEKLLSKLAYFLNGVFEENLYQENPIFRGIYFSSALREGSPISDFLKTTRLIPKNPTNLPANKGVFLKDFFQNILPKDRNLIFPLPSFLSWKKVVNNLGSLSYLLFTTFLIGLLSLSFYLNLKTISLFKQEFPKIPQLSNKLTDNLLLLDKMRLILITMEKQNQHWIIPRFGLTQSEFVEKKLKSYYTSLFEKGFLERFDNYLNLHISQINKNTPPHIFVDYLSFVALRMAIIANNLKDKKDYLAKEFTYDTTNLFEQIKSYKNIDELRYLFINNYYTYLNWNKNRAYFKERVGIYRKLLQELLSKKGNDLLWLVDKSIAKSPRVHLNDFWKVEYIGSYKNKIFVPAAYTKQGRENIKKFLALIKKYIQNAEIKKDIELKESYFWKWYKDRFYEEWYKFIQDFNIAISRIDNEENWKELAESMSKSYNPYFLLLDRLIKEIEAFDKDTSRAPYWVKELEKIQKVRNKSKELTLKKQGFILASLKNKAQNLTKNIAQSVDSKIAQEDLKLLERAKAFLDYINSLNMDISVANGNEIFEEYKKTFITDSLAKSKLVTAYKKYYRFKLTMNPYPGTNTVYDLIFGPLGFLLDFSSRKTSCYLQSKWEEDILSVAKESDRDTYIQNLFNKERGAFWKFYNHYLFPFIGKNEYGYFLRTNFRKRHLPFNKALLSLLNKSKKLSLNQKGNYFIELSSIPIAVNPQAKISPYFVNLTIDCSDKNFKLNNYNYPQTLKFNWSPKRCGDCTLVIGFPDTTLNKIYAGALGFAKFLQDFKGGTKVFFPKDFPQHTEYLKQAQIKWIRISYKIRGGEDILDLLHSIPKNLPQKIIFCPFEE